MNKTLIVANWKMNPEKPAMAKKIFTNIHKHAQNMRKIQTVVCPPSIFLPELAPFARGQRVQLGVQDLFYELYGAYTGQISPSMAKAYKAKWAILGHSERRALGESNALVAQKVTAAITHGYTAILCVGEHARNDEGEYYAFIRDELDAVFSTLRRAHLPHVVVAYEPIWAIGKAAPRAIQPDDLMEMSLFIRKTIVERFGRKSAAQVRILYGGSVKPGNTSAFLRDGGVDGLLVGSASLVPKQFAEILAEAEDTIT